MATIAKKKGVIFDLDGTLLDTVGDITDAVNEFLAGEGLAEKEESVIKLCIGNGTRMLLRRILPEGTADSVIEQKIMSFSVCYGNHLTKRTKPFEGIKETLSVLRENNIPFSVLSNKGNDFTQMLIGYFFPEFFFHAVVGHSEGIPVKPDPTGAKFCLAVMGIASSDTLYVGDSGVDMETASNAGMFGCGALWGYRSPEELKSGGAKALLNKPEEILKLI